MQPELSATYTAAQFGIAQISDGVAVIVTDGSADLILCEQTINRTKSIDLGAVADPGTGYFITESPPSAEEWSMVQASDGMALQTAGNQDRLFLFGSSNSLTMSVIGSNGLPGQPKTVATSEGTLTKVTTFTVVPDASGDLAAVSQKGVAGFNLFQIEDNGFLTLTNAMGDSTKSYVRDVVDSAAVLLDGDAYLLTISAGEAGITSYSVAIDGDISLIDSLGNIDGLAIAGAQAIQMAQVGGQTFAVIASTTSNSLSVVRVNDMGCLFQTDQVVDDLDSRIRGASALDVFEVHGRVFVVAGGSDAGLTTYEILPGGKLSQMDATAFETGQGMGNIASIDTTVDGDFVSIYVTEENGQRVQIFVSDFSDLGNLMLATTGQTNGTSQDDRLLGRSGDDTLNGNAGDDYLHDGAGADRLIGGSGADVFVICADKDTDTIYDFENGTDLIDLSEWGRIYSASDLTITSTSTGAKISYGDNLLIVTSSLGGSLGENALTDADFLF